MPPFKCGYSDHQLPFASHSTAPSAFLCVLYAQKIPNESQWATQKSIRRLGFKINSDIIPNYYCHYYSEAMTD